MFGMGWSELILIGVIALIVVGPKDFPNMFRALGQFTGKARTMAREFSRAMEAAADDAGVKDIQKTVRAAANPSSFGAEQIRNAAKGVGKPPDRGLKTPTKGKVGSEDAKQAAAEDKRAARDAEIAEMEAEAADDVRDTAEESEAPSIHPSPEPPAAKPSTEAAGTTKDE